MSESFLEKSKAFEGVYFADAYQLNTKALDGVIFVKKEELVDLAREANAALATSVATVKRLTALNSAKQELVDWLSTQLDGFFEPYEGEEITEYKRLVARIRSLENE